MKTAQPPLSAFRPGRHLQFLDDKIHDSYQSREKLPEPAVCGSCGLSYHHGSWQWTSPPADAVKVECPACRRIHQHQPAGYVTITGSFAQQHRDEILNLINNHETYEKVEHPLQRIMTVLKEEGRVQIETTDVHLAQGIGEALEHAYGGDLSFHFSEDEHLLRMRWER